MKIILCVYNVKIRFCYISETFSIFFHCLAVFLIPKRFYKTQHPNSDIVLHIFVYVNLKVFHISQK